jgi:hypothetical protein
MNVTKKAGKLLLLAIASEAVIMTDSLAGLISGSITLNVVVRGALSFLLVYLFWSVGIVLVRRFYKRQADIQFTYNQNPNFYQILLGLTLLLVTNIISYFSWSGFKVLKELMYGIQNGGIGLGITYFIVQYFYYFLETVLIVMILSFAQEAGTIYWGKKNIPYGGFVLAIIWGLVHIAFHGVVDGLTSTVCAMLYGCAFLTMRKNVKYAFPLIFLMFIL